MKKETIRDERSFEYFGPSSNVKLQRLLFPSSPFSTNYRHYYTDARLKCALFRWSERTLLLAMERRRGGGLEGNGRGGETDRVMYYRTEIDYWKRYQSYKHSLPLILQSCDVEPSHRRPSLLIPPPAIHPLSLSLFLSLSLSLPSYLSTFLSRESPRLHPVSRTPYVAT